MVLKHRTTQADHKTDWINKMIYVRDIIDAFKKKKTEIRCPYTAKKMKYFKQSISVLISEVAIYIYFVAAHIVVNCVASLTTSLCLRRIHYIHYKAWFLCISHTQHPTHSHTVNKTWRILTQQIIIGSHKTKKYSILSG